MFIKKDAPQGNKNDFPKADAFLNVSVKLASGEKQIGGIPLHLNKALHAFLIENKEQLDQGTYIMDINVVAEEQAQELKFA